MKIAVFTPLGPARSGIADYSETLLPHMAEHASVEVFIDEGYEPRGFPAGVEIPIRRSRGYRPEDFDATLYQFGNNPFHVYVHDMALRRPGVALLHEYNFHHLVADATIKRGDWDAYMRELEYDGGSRAMARGERVRALEVGPDYDGVPMNRRIIETAKAVIVHSEFMVGKVREVRPDVPIERVPHGAWIPEVDGRARRARLGIEESAPLIGIFGFLKPYKRIKECLAAMRRLVKASPRARMILVGEEHPELPTRRLIEDHGLSEHVRVLGYAAGDEFVELMAACDICLNLRRPSVGETSGTLLRALGLGRAVIVSDVGAFADLPNDVCLKVPTELGEEDYIFEYLNLLVSRPAFAREMGARARRYVATECAWPDVGRRFVEALARFSGLAEPSPPAARARSLGASAAESVARAEARRVEDEIAPLNGTAGGATTAAVVEELRSWTAERPADTSYVETHLTRLARTFEVTPPGGPEKSVLEMGAYLHLTPLLKTRLGYGEVRGCYLGPLGRVDRARAVAADGAVFECDVDLFNAETDVYPYPDGRFDVVLCCELLEHLYEDPMHMMAEINRVLKPDGRLVLSTPNICSLRAVAAALLTYHPGLFHQYVTPDREGRRDPRHAREYAPRDAQHLLEAAGFEVVRLETCPYRDEASADHLWVKDVLRRHELPNNLRDDCILAVGRKIGPVRERYPAALYAGASE